MEFVLGTVVFYSRKPCNFQNLSLLYKREGTYGVVMYIYPRYGSQNTSFVAYESVAILEEFRFSRVVPLTEMVMGSALRIRQHSLRLRSGIRLTVKQRTGEGNEKPRPLLFHTIIKLSVGLK